MKRLANALRKIAVNIQGTSLVREAKKLIENYDVNITRMGLQQDYSDDITKACKFKDQLKELIVAFQSNKTDKKIVENLKSKLSEIKKQQIDFLLIKRPEPARITTDSSRGSKYRM